MENREQLAAILSLLLDDINHYLNHIKPTVYAEEEQERLGIWKYTNTRALQKNGVLYDEANKRYICIKNNGFRNLGLLAKRVENMLNFKETLQDHLANLKDDPNISDVHLQNTVATIKTELQTAVEKNTVLNSEYNKHHNSYTQNRLSGMGFFGALWHKSFFQSRAMAALEKAHSHLVSFEQRFAARPGL